MRYSVCCRVFAGVLAFVGSVVTVLRANAEEFKTTFVERPPAGRCEHYIGSRPPLQATPLVKLPVGQVRPRGWLEKQLRLQADGFHGHLGEISRFLKKEGNAWLSGKGRGDHGWEEVPYWLKGYSNCAYLLGDKSMIAETKTWIEGAIASQKPDGWFGPDQKVRGVAARTQGREDLWPNMIMLFCLQDYYEFTGDRRVIDLMTRYFRYLNDEVPADKLLNGYWPVVRGGDLLFSVYWLYDRTGEPWLLELAKKVHADTARWDEDVINWHNVNIAQAFGEPGTYYLQSGNDKDLQAAYRNFAKVHELYGQVPGGMFGADENARPGYNGPRQAIETCGIVEQMLSDETLLCISGDPFWADHCEQVAFNSLPAALTADMKALRYLTAPNQPLSDAANKSPGVQNRGPMFLMSPHTHRCCQHNWGHGWPYFTEHLWAATPDGGLAAAMYAPSEVTATVGQGEGGEVSVREDTHYPFDEQVTLQIATAADIAFPLYLRVPGWCKDATVAVNDEACDVKTRPDGYIMIERTWRDRDRVELTLPMQVRVVRWPENHDFASIDRGPLTYSLDIGEKYVRDGGTDEWPAWEIQPTAPWNYGLVLDQPDPAAEFTVTKRDWPKNDMPFTQDGVPIRLEGPAKKIPNWQLDYLGLVGKMQDSPVLSDQPTETITLIPMGAARLRISAFPVIGQGPKAHQWQTNPPAPPHPTLTQHGVKISGSHCFEHDTLAALNDGRLPDASADNHLPRQTFWPHCGTKEWLEYEFPEPRTVSAVEVYWFDDSGRGRCRVPKAWQLEYRDGDAWKPIAAEKFGVAADQFNRVEFSPIKTTALRLQIRLQDGFSAGVLEWKCE